ncbi:MAG: DUF937 domain-containing protein [Oscillatoriales cyanobacterium C42_A2020_001]|nr:DUF937 domain-containing protein [Leptolyngbyaceae cyanobacterium C42_A2020_001]
MGLFFDVLSAINNPDQQGSVAQLENVTNTMQQLATSQGLDATKLQSILTAAGGLLGPALKQQGSLPGGAQLGNLVNQVGGTGAPAAALQSLFPPQLQQQLIQGIAQKTGISASMIQGLLPSLLPAIMGLLNMGASNSGTGTNPLLNAFLSGGDGTTDLGDVFKFANRFLNPA